jgi:excisionase family DNA binding protein
MSASPYMTQGQLALLLNISERTLERWRIEGTGPAFTRAGRRVLYSRDIVEHWLTVGSRRSTSDQEARYR